MNIYSELWLLMAWCINTTVSPVTLLSMYPCISSGLGVKKNTSVLDTLRPEQNGHTLIDSIFKYNFFFDIFFFC